MTTFASRMTQAYPHELAVLDRLRSAGWDAEPCGQTLFSQTLRRHFRNTEKVMLLRWAPDIIAARMFLSGFSQVVFVDAKAGDRWRTSGNHDVEISALEAAEQWERTNRGCIYYFIFSDWSVVTCEEIRDVAHRGPDYGNGSGTPYLLFPVTVGSAFDVIFPADHS